MRLWKTIQHTYSLVWSITTQKIHSNDLTAEDPIVLKWFHHKIAPQAGHSTELSNRVLIALYYVFSKIQVNWASLVSHNIATCNKIVGGSWHFPHLISKLFGVGFLNVPLTKHPITAYEQPFTSGSFRKKWLNLHSTSGDDSTHLLLKDILDLKQRMMLIEKNLWTTLRSSWFSKIRSTGKENSTLSLPIWFNISVLSWTLTSEHVLVWFGFSLLTFCDYLLHLHDVPLSLFLNEIFCAHSMVECASNTTKKSVRNWCL